MDNSDVKALLAPGRQLSNARVKDLQSNPQSLFQPVALDLSVAATEANPFKVGFPFKCVYVALATDTSTIAYLKPATKLSNAGAMPLGRKDVIDFDIQIPGAYLYWTAQPGKTMTLFFILDASFKSGSQISQNSGGVSINEGSSFDAQTRVTLAATTATIILPANADRKVGTFENATSAELYIGSATVTNFGATRGLKIPAGGFFYWRNTAALYGYSVPGGDVHYIDEE